MHCCHHLRQIGLLGGMVVKVFDGAGNARELADLIRGHGVVLKFHGVRIRVKQPGGDPIVDGVAVRQEKAACTFTKQSAGCFFMLSGRLKTYFTAEFPPSAGIAAPVIKLLIGLTKNKIAAAISSGRAMRFTACSPSAHARC